MTSIARTKHLRLLLQRREHRELRGQVAMFGLPRHLECHRVWPDEWDALARTNQVWLGPETWN